MNQTIPSPSGFLMTTTPSDPDQASSATLGRSGDSVFLANDRIPDTASAEGNVFFLALEESRPESPAGVMDLDDLITEFEQDPAAKTAIRNGRKWVAGEFYRDGPAGIRALRLERGLSQVQLARAMGTSQSHVARIERGTEDLRTSTIVRLAPLLGLQPEDLFRLIVSIDMKKVSDE